jgi:hypothetical protein
MAEITGSRCWTGNRILHRRGLLHLGLFVTLGAFVATALPSCGNLKQRVVGRWQANPIISIYFYPDQTASISSIGILRLKWDIVGENLIRIEALDKSIVTNFRIERDDVGDYGILELAGYDALVFRRAD